jgi:hypothetical protein
MNSEQRKGKNAMQVTYKTVVWALGFLILGGCKTPPPSPPQEIVKTEMKVVETLITQVPLTSAILDRLSLNLGKTQNEIITKHCQLYISGRLTLEREDPKQEDKAEGQLRLTDIYIRTIREIKPLTPGMAIEGPLEEKGEKIIKVGFDNGVKTDLLEFAQKGEDVYFYLKHTPGTSTTGYEKGTIKYGDNDFIIKYAAKPYLLVQINQEDRYTEDRKEIKGWKYEPPR